MLACGRGAGPCRLPNGADGKRYINKASEEVQITDMFALFPLRIRPATVTNHMPAPFFTPPQALQHRAPRTLRPSIYSGGLSDEAMKNLRISCIQNFAVYGVTIMLLRPLRSAQTRLANRRLLSAPLPGPEMPWHQRQEAILDSGFLPWACFGSVLNESHQRPGASSPATTSYECIFI